MLNIYSYLPVILDLEITDFDEIPKLVTRNNWNNV